MQLGAVSKMETNQLHTWQDGANGGHPDQPASPGLGWAGLGPQPPPDDVMLAPASTAHVWTFQTVLPPPAFPPRVLTHSFLHCCSKQISEAKCVSWLPGRLSAAGMEGHEWQGSLGVQRPEDPEMGYWKQPGLTCVLTQPPRHQSSI